MTSTSASPQSVGVKRAYQPDDKTSQPQQDQYPAAASPPANSASATSAFRNVSACNRCRVRKNRCDQRLPACSTCEKASVRCVGYDPINKREIPRSYVYYLETRLAYFERLLKANDISFNHADVYGAESKELGEDARSPNSTKTTWVGPQSPSNASPNTIKNEDWDKKQEDADNLNKLVSNIGMVSVQGASDARYLGSTSGISFARVVLAAVKSSVSTNNSERAATRPSRPNLDASGGSSMRDSYFGLQTKPTIKEAPFPDRQLGAKLVNLYFEHANPQIPILHRGEFLDIFDRNYSIDPAKRTSRDLYLLNIVFAIGAGIIWGSSDPVPISHGPGDYASKRPRLASQQAQPEEYHASAIVNLGPYLSANSSLEGAERPNGDLEELQAVLLLCSFALLRPVAPGLWYIVGVAMRLAVDLGLHYEDGSGIEQVAEARDTTKNGVDEKPTRSVDAKEKGRREWVRDLRRRLWWCTYTFDRLVSTCVGRPFGITDQVVTTDFPSLLDDKYITRGGFLHQQLPVNEPTYKCVSHHYFRLRLLQSEILQVLQHQQAQQARLNGTTARNTFMHTQLPSPFLSKFNSFRSWRKDIDQRLYDWKESAPETHQTGVAFSVQFLELNYWQAVIMLYRQSLSVPPSLANELSPTEDVSSPSSVRMEEKEDEETVFLKCAEAGQKTLKLYRQLHRLRLVNYTYLATHHLFMAGISFLYAVWHSPAVRARLTLDDFDWTVLSATSVLGDLMEKCPPAEACRDAFERMSKATVQMCMSTPGFGFSAEHEKPRGQLSRQSSTLQSPPVPMNIDSYPVLAPKPPLKRPPPKFDMDLRDLFPDDLERNVRPSQSFPQPLQALQRTSQQQRPAHFPPIQPAQQSSPRQHQQSPASSINFQINAGLGLGGAQQPGADSSNVMFNQQQQQSSPPFYMQNTYNPDFMSSLPGMDFLNHITGPGAGAGDDLSFDNSGLDLGYGLNFDQQHDWSDAQQYDLFDGFFFGNNSGVNGNGNNNGFGGASGDIKEDGVGGWGGE